MTPRDAALAVLVSVVWGLAFVAIKIGLDSFSASQLTALRFIVAGVPALFLPRPRVPWSTLIWIGLTLFTGQFLLIFFAYKQGLPAGLASVTQQTQAFFTIGLAAAFLHDVPTRRQVLGMVVAIAGLALVASTIGGDLSSSGLALALAAAFSWAVGNVLVKRLKDVPMFPLIAWLSLVPPLPALLVSYFFEHDRSLLEAVAVASWPSLAAALYLGAVATTLAYALWAWLLARHPAAVVAPFSLLAPCTGVVASAIVLGEEFGALRSVGMILIVASLAVIVAPANGWHRAVATSNPSVAVQPKRRGSE